MSYTEAARYLWDVEYLEIEDREIEASEPDRFTWSEDDIVVDKPRSFHLPGQHSQASHGSGGSSRPMDFEKSKTAEKIRSGELNSIDNASHADLILGSILSERGFDGKPDIVSEVQLNEYIANGEIELYRGINGQQYAEQFRSGDLFPGIGTWGNGTYTMLGGSEQALLDAKIYAGSSKTVMRMSLKSDVNVVKFSELADELDHVKSQKLKLLEDNYVERYLSTKTIDDRKALENWNVRETNVIVGGYNDAGRYAAILGYDAIHVESKDYYIVLNRTKVRIQETDL